MPRYSLNKDVSWLAKYRLNKGETALGLAKKASISYATVYRFERGEPVSRLVASRYLNALGVDLANEKKWPPKFKFIDMGSAVAIQLED